MTAIFSDNRTSPNGPVRIYVDGDNQPPKMMQWLHPIGSHFGQVQSIEIFASLMKAQHWEQAIIDEGEYPIDVKVTDSSRSKVGEPRNIFQDAVRDADPDPGDVIVLVTLDGRFISFFDELRDRGCRVVGAASNTPAFELIPRAETWYVIRQGRAHQLTGSPARIGSSAAEEGLDLARSRLVAAGGTMPLDAISQQLEGLGFSSNFFGYVSWPKMFLGYPNLFRLSRDGFVQLSNGVSP